MAVKYEEILREKKTHVVANEVFSELKKRAKIEIVLDHPEKEQQMPGIAAAVNSVQITVRQLAEECVARDGAKSSSRHRPEAHRAVLPAAERRRQPAGDRGGSGAGGCADAPAPARRVARRPGLPEDGREAGGRFRGGLPSRRRLAFGGPAQLVGDKVKITKEDMQNGFEANYGPRVRCRAIVLDQLRKAQEVWQKARKRPTLENFAELATQYSIEGASRSLEGRVPPIARHNGQPNLEKEAFALQPGELSGVIQLGDKFVILFCEGYTTPEPIEYAKVRDLVYDDIREKKLHMAMADLFDHLQETATVDNFLGGKSRSGTHITRGPAGGSEPSAGRYPVLRAMPTRDAG